MVAVMLVATFIAAVYIALIALHVQAIHGDPPGTDRRRPRIATWLATREERRRGRAESDAAQGLMSGSLDRASYRAAMAAMAAQDAAEHPVEIPNP
ncbi:hypothetical protein AB0J72_42435 [Dactylosporangium sp. NPDC049742]|uniref:hypothetical protein n=1 Tax=Dactylosporangium sp. NPDC049742 TaxID=3154737 RepID=UPI00341974DD